MVDTCYHPREISESYSKNILILTNVSQNPGASRFLDIHSQRQHAQHMTNPTQL